MNDYIVGDATELAARCAKEALLVRVAAQIDAVRPWRDRLPRIVAP